MHKTTVYTLYHRTSTGAVKVWSVWGESEYPNDGGARHIVTREWGILGGKLQTSPDVMTSRGKVGSKAFRSEFAVMHDTIIRLLAKQLEEGYVLNQDDVREDVAMSVEDMSFVTIPKNFCPQKPLTGLTDDELATYMAKRECVIELKRNGIRAYLMTTPTGDMKLFSRKLEDLTAQFQPWLDDLKRLNIIPPSSILDGELLAFPLLELRATETKEDGTAKTRRGLIVSPIESFKAISGITRSDPERAVTMYGENAPVYLMYMPFDVLYSKGDVVYDRPYRERLDYIKALSERIMGAMGMKDDWWTISMPTVFPDLKTGQEFVAHNKKTYEGLVIWDNNAPAVVTMNGKPKRHGCAKWKPLYSADVIATGYEEGKGKRNGQAGALYISIRKEDGSLKDAGKCGSGLTDTDSAEIPSWTFPCVVEIEYADQDEESDKFQFPVFVRKRDDKTIEEATEFEGSLRSY